MCIRHAITLNMEEWKDVPGYEGIYKISNEGRVKRCAGSLYTKTDRFIKGDLNRGYWRVQLKDKQRTERQTIHRLVALAFCPNPESKPHVNHIDGNKLNNHASNLEWVTSGENKRHSLTVPAARLKRKNRGAYQRANGKWRVMICFAGKTLCLGTYETQEKALSIYRKAYVDHYGFEPWDD